MNKKYVIAHRSASGYLPEHSLAAVAMAYAWGVDFLEPDIVLTKDSKPIVLHDIYLDTTTDIATKFSGRERGDGRFYAIDFTLDEIKSLSLTERFHVDSGEPVFEKRFPLRKSSFAVPSFAEYIELIQGLNKSMDKNIGIYPELKNPEFHLSNQKDIAEAVFGLLCDYGYNDESAPIFIQCFYPPTLKRLKFELGSKMPQILLLGENSWGVSATIDYDYLKCEAGLKEHLTYINGVGAFIGQLIQPDRETAMPSSLAKRVKKLGLKLHAFTHRSDNLSYKVDDNYTHTFSSDLEAFNFLFREVGIDGLFSDFSDRVISFLKTNNLN